MKRMYISCLLYAIAASAFAETTIIIRSPSEVPVYRVESIVIDPVSETVVNDFDIYYESLVLAAIGPASFTVPNGDHLFAISTGGYNRMIPVRATGEDVTISIKPAQPYADYVLIGSGVALAAAFYCIDNVTGASYGFLYDDPWFYAAAVFGTGSVTGLIWWLANLPRITVK